MKLFTQDDIASTNTAQLPVRRGPLLLAWVILVVFCLLGPFMSYSGLPGTGEGSPVRQAGYLAVFALAIYGSRPLIDPKRLLVVPIAIVVALAWVWLSIAWALDPGIAVRRAFLTTTIIWSIFAIVRRVGVDQPLMIARILLVVLLVINTLVSILFPDIGVHSFNEPADKGLIGDWRGIMTHKNFAGPTVALLILMFAFDARKIPTVLRVIVIAGASYFLYRSGSKTSAGMVVSALIIGAMFLYYKGRGKNFIMVLTSLVGMAAVAAAYVYKDPLSGNFTDERSFTGRPSIWKALTSYWSDHPWTGSGFGSFWNIGPQGPIYRYASGWVTEVATGHNGFLDLLATVGIPGLLLILIATVIVPVFTLLSRADPNAPRNALIISMLFFCIGHNATESTLFDRDAIPEVFLMFSIAAIANMESKRSDRSKRTRVSRAP
ncbi:MAG: O-antigen ligase family protein [Sphingobium sp.]